MTLSKSETGLPERWLTGVPAYGDLVSSSVADVQRGEDFGLVRALVSLPEPTDPVFEAAFEYTPRHLRSSIPIAKGTAAHSPRPQELSADMLAIVMSAKFADTQKQFSREIAEVRADVSAVRDAVELLAAAMQKTLSAPSEVRLTDHKPVTENQLRDALNAAADAEQVNSTLAPVAEEALRSSTPSVRAAAARALAAIDPKRALALLPASVEQEVSKVAKRIMVSALRAAAL